MSQLTLPWQVVEKIGPPLNVCGACRSAWGLAVVDVEHMSICRLWAVSLCECSVSSMWSKLAV
eukprot:5816160-Alexandrium_andersonii.AAC.1